MNAILSSNSPHHIPASATLTNQLSMFLQARPETVTQYDLRSCQRVNRPQYHAQNRVGWQSVKHVSCGLRDVMYSVGQLERSSRKRRS